MTTKLQVRQSNVIAFPHASRTPVVIKCEEPPRIAICSHCGGVLAKGESEDDCSSARAFRSS